MQIKSKDPGSVLGNLKTLGSADDMRICVDDAGRMYYTDSTGTDRLSEHTAAMLSDSDASDAEIAHAGWAWGSEARYAATTLLVHRTRSGMRGVHQWCVSTPTGEPSFFSDLDAAQADARSLVRKGHGAKTVCLNEAFDYENENDQLCVRFGDAVSFASDWLVSSGNESEHFDDLDNARKFARMLYKQGKPSVRMHECFFIADGFGMPRCAIGCDVDFLPPATE